MDRLSAMKTFVKVVDAGSFSAAARQLCRGQPAVSKAIAHLEEYLGVRLLVRSTRTLAPTEAGLHFYERARRSIEEADEAELAARGAGSRLTGTLRVAAGTTFAQLHVVPALGAFLRDHPQLEIELVLDDRRIDAIEEGIDVALRLGELADSSAVVRRIGRSPRSVIASKDYIDSRGRPGTPAELASHEAVVYTQNEQRAWTFVRGRTHKRVALRGRLRVSSAEAIRSAVIANLGLTIASNWMFHPELIAGRVERLLPDWELPPLDLWAVFPTGRLVTAKAREFVRFVEKQI